MQHTFLFGLAGLAGLIRSAASQWDPLSWIDVNPKVGHDTAYVEVDGTSTSVSHTFQTAKEASGL
jgi:hypothetical protein